MEAYKKEEKDGRLEELRTGLSKNCNEIMENLCKKLIGLENELSLEGDDYFVIETIIEKRVEEFDIKECLLVLAGIFDLKDSNFVLDILERKCLIKVLNFLGTHPLRLHRIMMYTDWIFKKECEHVLETENVEKLRSLAITLGMHFDNLISLLRSITDEKDKEAVRNIFRNIFRDIFRDIFKDLAKEIKKIIPIEPEPPVMVVSEPGPPVYPIEPEPPVMVVSEPGPPVYPIEPEPPVMVVSEPEPQVRVIPESELLVYIEPRVVAGIKVISFRESISKRLRTKKVAALHSIEPKAPVRVVHRRKVIPSKESIPGAGYKSFIREEYNKNIIKKKKQPSLKSMEGKDGYN